MFANFIYLIIALLILSLYEPVETPHLSLSLTLFIFVALIALFAAYTRFQFRRLARVTQWEDQIRLDHHFSLLLTRHTILALVLFAIDIWGLNLPTFLEPIHWMSLVPTLKALLFLLLFVGYLMLVWISAFDAHQKIYNTGITRKSYVSSNIAFTIPVLIPWALLFGITDIIGLLPLELPKRLLNSPAGQIGYFVFFLFAAAIFAPALMQRFWGCRPLADGPYRSRIESLCRRAKVGYANIVHWPIFGGRMITAGVMGLVSKFRYIMVTEALMKLLTPDQVDQVIAHEIGHVKHKHLQLYLMFFIGVMLISYTVFPLGYYLIFSKPALKIIIALGFDINSIFNYFTSALLVIGVVLYFRYLFGYFMRNFERQADVYVFKLFPTARPLIDTFGKIVATSGQPADKPNWHHFSIQQRIDYLRLCESSPNWIAKQHRKVKQSIIIVMIAFLLLGASAFHLNQTVFDGKNRSINIEDIERYLVQKQIKTANDGLLYWLVGNIYYEQQNLKRAATAYEASLALNPDNPDALNNLAWLLVSGDDPELKDPRQGLQLAQKAITMKKAPHIWDTLAEALYSNGRVREALEAEQNALSMNPEDRKIYEAQLQKFKQALNQ